MPRRKLTPEGLSNRPSREELSARMKAAWQDPIIRQRLVDGFTQYVYQRYYKMTAIYTVRWVEDGRSCAASTDSLESALTMGKALRALFGIQHDVRVWRGLTAINF